MKNTTKILFAIIFLSVIGVSGFVNAANSNVYISPSTTSKNAGSVFSASVRVNPQGDKVCAVEGTLVLNNLTCQSIALSTDVMAQSTPTCSNPYYLIGIPGCTTTDKAILTVAVKGQAAGTASIGQTNVDIIGEGISLGSTSVSGNYTISAAPVTQTPEVTTQPTTTQPQPEVTQTPEEQPAETQPTNLEQASLASTNFNYAYLWIGLIILVVIAIIYFIIKRKK